MEDAHSLLNIDTRNVEAYYVLGCAYEKMGEIDYAIENFSLVLELDYTHVNALLARGACLNRKKEFKAGLYDYEMALQLDSKKPYIRTSSRASYRKIENDGDLVQHNQGENQYRLIQIDTSQINNQNINSGNMELMRGNSTTSLKKTNSLKLPLEDPSLQEITLIQDTISTASTKTNRKLKEADEFHSMGW